VKIGLTIDNSYSLFCNGLNQNILFLYWLLDDIGHNPVLIDFSDANKDPEFGCRAVDKSLNIIARVDLLRDPNQVDLLLSPGVAYSAEEVKLLKSTNKNLKNVAIHYGNMLIDDIQRVIFKTGANMDGDYSNIYDSNLDEVWLSPHYHFSASYLELMHRRPVRILPYIWDPAVIDLVQEIKGDFSYKPNPRERVVGVCEPNINFSKNCFIPICILEKNYRDSQVKFDRAIIYGAQFLTQKSRFEGQILGNFDMPHTKGKICFLDRASPDLVHRDDGVNIIVSHQHYNSLNYAHLEALHLNYPLIHNSDDIMDAGYHYSLFDIDDGAEALESALLNHDKNLEDYAKRSKGVIDKCSIKNEQIKQEYIKLIENLK